MKHSAAFYLPTRTQHFVCRLLRRLPTVPLCRPDAARWRTATVHLRLSGRSPSLVASCGPASRPDGVVTAAAAAAAEYRRRRLQRPGCARVRRCSLPRSSPPAAAWLPPPSPLPLAGGRGPPPECSPPFPGGGCGRRHVVLPTVPEARGKAAAAPSAASRPRAEELQTSSSSSSSSATVQRSGAAAEAASRSEPQIRIGDADV